jgi:hypothetical protein
LRWAVRTGIVSESDTEFNFFMAITSWSAFNGSSLPVNPISILLDDLCYHPSENVQENCCHFILYTVKSKTCNFFHNTPKIRKILLLSHFDGKAERQLPTLNGVCLQEVAIRAHAPCKGKAILGLVF